MKITSDLPHISYYACKIKSVTTVVTICLVRILFKSANQSILLRHDSFEKPYKQLELVFHRDISKHSKRMDKNTRAARSCFHHCFLVFGYPGETLALVVHILQSIFYLHIQSGSFPSERNQIYSRTVFRQGYLYISVDIHHC